MARFHGARGGAEDLQPHVFPATGTNEVCGFLFRDANYDGYPVANSQVGVDNSGTSTEGSFYINSPGIEPDDPLITYGFDVDGNLQTELHARAPIEEWGSHWPCSVAVDDGGNVYVNERYAGVQKYAHNDPVTDADYTETVEGLGTACNFTLRLERRRQGVPARRHDRPSLRRPLLHQVALFRVKGRSSEAPRATEIVFEEVGPPEITDTLRCRDRRDQRHPLRLGHAQRASGRLQRVARLPSRPRPQPERASAPSRRAKGRSRTAATKGVRRLLPALDRRARGDPAAPLESRRLDRLRRDQPWPATNAKSWSRTETAKSPRPSPGSNSRSRPRPRGPAAASSAPPIPWARSRAAATAAPAAAPMTRAPRSSWSRRRPATRPSPAGRAPAPTRPGPARSWSKAAPSVTAHFTAQHPISVKKAGTGAGSVVSEPNGLDCGGVCVGFFTDGQTVTLSAISSGNSTFTGWSGEGCSGTGDLRGRSRRRDQKRDRDLCPRPAVGDDGSERHLRRPARGDGERCGEPERGAGDELRDRIRAPAPPTGGRAPASRAPSARATRRCRSGST